MLPSAAVVPVDAGGVAGQRHAFRADARRHHHRADPDRPAEDQGHHAALFVGVDRTVEEIARPVVRFLALGIVAHGGYGGERHGGGHERHAEPDGEGVEPRPFRYGVNVKRALGSEAEAQCLFGDERPVRHEPEVSVS